ncbi:DNA-(apurinic or apyrimidinic site) endonuclease 2 isoform X1 [Phoenix dactylifera]|uniref:DNA-(apurinic or apyrimidinic site) endonuclease 2 n=1 Tax=Phoenix dactylifera TaxID=42345 RepID=A0A8B8J409_PHODC|nr:DNA-(apurinic or apyrimidinic site) endonuclease 2 isoform X1 [Phoenix dactylifera]
MKIVTYNVNGLRQRVSQHGSLLRLLNSLDADIICFQETKLSRQELSADVTMAEGYEAFVSCTRTSNKGRTGYSGVATFCRVRSSFSSNEVALPVAAEEGFTGLLECLKKREITRDFLHTPVEVEGLSDITNEDLLKVDSEGRCLITDHGHFVLFNIYGPRAEEDDKERIQFKLLFFRMLEKRLESLLTQGKRVFVAGDLNIAPAAIDKCDAEPGFEKNMFRKWLRSLLQECRGSFFDVFRSKHPERKEAYTCFPQCVGAEEFNYGSRIDHILIAGPCLHQNHNLEGHNLLDCHVEVCDIMTQFKRGNSDNTPKWNGGRSTKLEGSDHVPVYVVLRDIPDLSTHDTPSLAVRYFPEVRGWQQTIVSFLMKRKVSSNCKHHSLSNFSSVEDTLIENCGECVECSLACGTKSQHVNASDVSHSSGQDLPYFNSGGESFNSNVIKDSSITVDGTQNTLLRLKTEPARSLSHCKLKLKKKGGHSNSSQLTLTSFFQKPNIVRTIGVETVNTGGSSTPEDTEKPRDNLSHVTEGAGKIFSENVKDSSSERNDSSISSHVQEQGCSDPSFFYKKDKDNVAILEWQRIQEKMKKSLPLCKGHREPCVARSVKKGPNTGRQFYVCARAKGPASNQEANCDHFQWASVKSKENRR